MRFDIASLDELKKVLNIASDDGDRIVIIAEDDLGNLKRLKFRLLDGRIFFHGEINE